ncbi:MAG: sirohydrochlorin cobaltochelatase [Bacteroidaceae bacterium]|nr:sirohydrochlorin cobaltochelatase [Bacteroidaceae bacterium]
MKQIKFLFVALAAMVMSAGFTACSDDDEQQQGNFEKYLSSVESQVKAKKAKSGNKKALLLVAFGSTWENAHQTFKGIVADYEGDNAFKDYDVYFSFTSAICINKSREGEHYASQDFYAPNFWLEAIGRQKYEEVRVQSLHVIPGEEYLRLRDTYIKDFKNNVYGDLDNDYLEEGVKVFIGGPLMAEEEDVKDVATALNGYFSQYVQGDNAMVFLGHGNPEGYNYGNGNIRYTQLEEQLQAINPNYFVATVDMEDNLIDDLWANRMEGKVKDGVTITLHALMCIAGDHAHNDMSGIENEGDSWREFFQEQGFTCNYDGNDANSANNCILKGLGDYANIRAIWKKHTKEATEMFAEEEE